MRAWTCEWLSAAWCCHTWTCTQCVQETGCVARHPPAQSLCAPPSTLERQIRPHDAPCASAKGRLAWRFRKRPAAACQPHSAHGLPLTECGSDPDLTDATDCSALLRGAAQGHAGVVDKLLSYGASPDLVNTAGCSALISAGDHLPVVKRLLQQGADVDIRDSSGFTALIYASANGYEEIARRLVHAGAQVDIADGNGLTAFDHAKQQNHTSILHLLDPSVSRPPSARRMSCVQRPLESLVLPLPSLAARVSHCPRLPRHPIGCP